MALEDALFLARGCRKVYLIHRRDAFRGAKVLQQQVQAKENIVCLMDSVVDRILGQDMVEKLHISNTKTKEATDLPVQGIFIAVGIKPNTDTIQGLPKRDEAGYILAAEDGVTDIPGIFCCRGLQDKTTASGDHGGGRRCQCDHIRGTLFERDTLMSQFSKGVDLTGCEPFAIMAKVM